MGRRVVCRVEECQAPLSRRTKEGLHPVVEGVTSVTQDSGASQCSGSYRSWSQDLTPVKSPRRSGNRSEDTGLGNQSLGPGALAPGTGTGSEIKASAPEEQDARWSREPSGNQGRRGERRDHQSRSPTRSMGPRYWEWRRSWNSQLSA